MTVRTSESDPLQINSVRVPGSGGEIGMTLCPGRRDRLSPKGPWARDLGADLDVVRAWGPALVITLLEEFEFTLLGVPRFAGELRASGLNWRHIAIRDAGTPNAAFELEWLTAGREARELLRAGRRVLIHCRAGLGRTGLLAARLLVELGTPPDEAIAAVRKARPEAIETQAQADHVRQRSVVSDAPPPAREAKPGLPAALRERVRGSILGAAIGDALGAPFEFASSARIESALGSPIVREYHEALPRTLLFPRRPGVPTDDTAMTLALIRALCRPEGRTPQIVHRTLVEALRNEECEFGKLFWRGGPGGACIAMLSHAQAGGGPFERINQRAGGNGAAMRAHVCGVFPDRAYVYELAGMQARLSHPHPGAVAAAQTIALIVHEALYTGKLATALPAEITEPNMVAAWERAHRGLERGERLPRHLRDADMAGWNTVAVAHAIAQLYADDLETGIGIAAGSGKDTDTVASIAGAMLGAVHGVAALPERWLEGLQLRAAIEDAAEQLLAQI